MPEPKREHLEVQAKRAVLVSVLTPGPFLDKDRALDEIQGLAETAGAKIVGRLIQVREQPDPATYMGRGKLEELKQLVAETRADLIVFDNTLSPAQGKNVEEETGKQVVDRSEVILDIFATHARSHEAKLQVELAQLLYMRPRLTRMWTHLERIEGGIGSGKGPGEKQLETDRRLVDRRIAELQRKLKDVEHRRARMVQSRRDHKTVSLVGYTNAGKSTLMNALTDAGVLVADQLFATLDTRTRKWTIPHYGDVLLSDTVGFIRDLPHHLVASFRSTLEEAVHAEVLLHVVDVSNSEAPRQVKTVNEVLKEIGVEDRQPILVLNKVDAVTDPSVLDIVLQQAPEAVAVSAHTGQGLEELTRLVAERLSGGFLDADVETSVGNGRLFAYLSEHAEIRETAYHNGRVVFRCRIPRRFLHSIADQETTITPVVDSTVAKG